jgi:hypothetical protein
MNPVHTERIILFWYEFGFELLIERRSLDRSIGRDAKLVEPHAITQRHLYHLQLFLKLPLQRAPSASASARTI